MDKQFLIKKNNIKIFGNGLETIFFLHGYGCDQNMWRYITPEFEDKYKIVLIDLVGSGNSDESKYDFNKYNTLQGYADDIIEIIESFDLKNIHIVGHSVSAMIALLSVIKNKDVFKSLIMIGPSPRYINDNDYIGGFNQSDIDGLIESLESNYLGWSKSIAPVIMGNPEKPELAEELANSFCKNNPDFAKHFARVTFTGDNRDDLHKTNIKTLIIQCSSDIIAPKEVGKYIHDKIKNSKYVEIENYGHCPHLSNPKETSIIIKDFIENND